MQHEDDRRIIYDWCQGDFKSAKALITKKICTVGDHHHLNKDEYFFLLQGKIFEMKLGEEIKKDIEAPFYIEVKRGTYHRFLLEEGSILLGTATELFDEKDEIK